MYRHNFEVAPDSQAVEIAGQPFRLQTEGLSTSEKVRLNTCIYQTNYDVNEASFVLTSDNRVEMWVRLTDKVGDDATTVFTFPNPDILRKIADVLDRSA